MLQTLKVEGGGDVLVELREIPAETDRALVGPAVESLEDMFRQAQPVINGIVHSLGELDLDEVSLKCTISLTVGGKILFFAKGGVEGSFELTLTWKPQGGQSA